jgi:hypothetical protein
MSRHHSKYYPPTLESLKCINDFQVRTALRVLFGERIDIDRNFLKWCGIDQFQINKMSDREVRKYDLKPFAYHVLHHSISALVSEHKPKEEVKSS